MEAEPLGMANDLLYLTGGSMAHAEHHVHDPGHHLHTHSFMEIVVVTGGEGVHVSFAGRAPIRTGDVILLRPGVWHGYEDCRQLDVFDCCLSTELLDRELAWTREDPLLGYLLWTGPFSLQRRGMLTASLDPATLAECVSQLDALGEIQSHTTGWHRGDMIGRLALFLSALARAVARDDIDEPARPTHPAVVDAMLLMESAPEHGWTLRELADRLHLAPGYLVRLFKCATGLPPIAYLSRHRVELAATQLLRTDDPIAHIARTVGWPDQNYFARRFKAHFGLSASVYRSRFNREAARLGSKPIGRSPV